MALKNLLPSLHNGLDKMEKNPQLWWTLITATVIVAAFLFIANLFVGVAQDSQDRLANVRAGALQESVIPFIEADLDNRDLLQNNLQKISASNRTIEALKIVSLSDESEAEIIASLNKGELFGPPDDLNQITTLALTDPENSYTVELIDSGIRKYRTTRSFTNSQGEVVGFIDMTQTLSEADQIIDKQIQSSLTIFGIVLVIVLLLFLRHAKIIDYSKLYRRLRETDQLKDDFISMASHELRTPLTVIRGYAELLRDEKTLSNEGRENTRRIDLAALQLDTLVNDMLNVSKIEQGRMSFEMKEINPLALVHSVVEGLKKPADEKGLSLVLKTKSSASIYVDPDRLRQVLNNLIGNAVKYTEKGEVAVSISLEGSDLLIRISDSGIGMSAEDQKRLFEKFYRVRNNKTKNIRGTGLGLWITDQIIRKMKGKISVESIEGVGTHFIIRFQIVA